MLALSVHQGDYITIGDDIVIQVLKTGDVFRVAIDAPRSMAIERAKIHEQTSGVPECIRKVQKLPPIGAPRRPSAAAGTVPAAGAVSTAGTIPAAEQAAR